MILEEHHMQLDRKWMLKIRSLPFIDYCDAHSKKTFLWNVRVVFLPPNHQPAVSFKSGTYQCIQVQLHMESRKIGGGLV
jgi:hypothetical protein